MNLFHINLINSINLEEVLFKVNTDGIDLPKWFNYFETDESTNIGDISDLFKECIKMQAFFKVFHKT